MVFNTLEETVKLYPHTNPDFYLDKSDRKSLSPHSSNWSSSEAGVTALKRWLGVTSTWRALRLISALTDWLTATDCWGSDNLCWPPRHQECMWCTNIRADKHTQKIKTERDSVKEGWWGCLGAHSFWSSQCVSLHLNLTGLFYFGLSPPSPL